MTVYMFKESLIRKIRRFWYEVIKRKKVEYSVVEGGGQKEKRKKSAAVDRNLPIIFTLC